jgi:hypothetical protein
MRTLVGVVRILRSALEADFHHRITVALPYVFPRYYILCHILSSEPCRAESVYDHAQRGLRTSQIFILPRDKFFFAKMQVVSARIISIIIVGKPVLMITEQEKIQVIHYA